MTTHADDATSADEGGGATVRIVPSTLGADLAKLAEASVMAEEAGADRIQWDVMDGHFVPNLTFGAGVVADARKAVEIPFEAHLMVTNPDRLLAEYVEAGCELIIVHAETCEHLHSTLGDIHGLGARAGVALNPATPLSAVEHVMDLLDLVLVMTVNPGFAGQAYLDSMEAKIAGARRMIDAAGRDIELEVDGGIGPDTIGGAARAGADTFCAGSAVYKTQDGPRAAVTDLRKRARAAREEARSGGSAGEDGDA